MVIVDQAGEIVLINRQTEKMFGFNRAELIGRNIEALLPKRIREPHVDLRTNYTKNPKPRPMGVEMELNGRRQNGDEFPVEISLSPVFADDSAFIASVIRDVSARKEMEVELIKARQEAERANSANSAFLAAASHDLRQPVQALNLLNGALRRTVKESKALEMLESQNQSLVAMTNLLNSLLDISRLDAGAMTAEFEQFPINQLIDQLESEFSRQAGQKGLSFAARRCDAVVHSDPNLLTEIMQNFVSNSIRYTKNGEIQLQCTQTDSHCRIEVRDTGIGIEPDKLEKIFEAFYQCKQPGSNNEGFGLGLAIVSRLADLLDHKINVESTLGEGSCFCISIPIVDTKPSTVDKYSGAQNNISKASASGTIILIEDDYQVAEALKLLLGTEGYDVVSATTRNEAVQVSSQMRRPPDLIISDYHLGDSSNGVETIDALRSHFDADIPALIITGDTSQVVDHARRIENSVLLNKPVDPDHILDLVEKAITNRQIEDN
jgi:PAS domain S-box-containing protein